MLVRRDWMCSLRTTVCVCLLPFDFTTSSGNPLCSQKSFSRNKCRIWIKRSKEAVILRKKTEEKKNHKKQEFFGL